MKSILVICLVIFFSNVIYSGEYKYSNDPDLFIQQIENEFPDKQIRLKEINEILSEIYHYSVFKLPSEFSKKSADYFKKLIEETGRNDYLGHYYFHLSKYYESIKSYDSSTIILIKAKNIFEANKDYTNLTHISITLGASQSFNNFDRDKIMRDNYWYGYYYSLKSNDNFAKAAGCWTILEDLISRNSDVDSIYFFFNQTNKYINLIPDNKFAYRNWAIIIRNQIISPWYRKNLKNDSIMIINKQTVDALKDNLNRKLFNADNVLNFAIAESYYDKLENYDSALVYINNIKEPNLETFHSIVFWNQVNRMKFNLLFKFNDLDEAAKIAAEIFKLESPYRNVVDPKLLHIEHLKTIENEKQKLAIENEKRKKENIFTMVVFVIFGSAIIFLILNNRYQKIQLLNKKLDEANNTKDKLFRIISHDLNAPLDSTLTLSEQIGLYQDKMSKEDIIKTSFLIHKSTMQLKSILTTLLEWSKMNLEGFKVEKKQVNCKKIINEVIDNLSFQIAQKNINVNLNANFELIVDYDADSLRVVLRNLLSNAIKFTPKNNSINIMLNDNSIEIIDSGEGFPESILEGKLNLTKSTSGTNNERGLGLGLQIVSDICEKYNTKIKFSNTEKGGCIVLEF